MGTAPQPAGAAPTGATASLDFPPSPSASSLCGFKFPPTVALKFSFKLPPLATLSPFPPLPSVHVGLALNCQASNPLDVAKDVPYGGGRQPNAPPDPDLLEQANS
jgi:hypothetical protein